jgi:hypothetical protein
VIATLGIQQDRRAAAAALFVKAGLMALGARRVPDVPVISERTLVGFESAGALSAFRDRFARRGSSSQRSVTFLAFATKTPEVLHDPPPAALSTPLPPATRNTSRARKR